MRRIFLPVVLVVGLAIVAVAQAASTLYAAPGGATSGECTDPGAPCELQYAIGKAAEGDTIELKAGTYTDANGFVLDQTLTLRGAAAGDRPVIESTNDGDSGLQITGAGKDATGSTLEHLAFKASSKTYAVTGNATDIHLKDVSIDTPGQCIQLAASSVEASTFKSGDGPCAKLTGTGAVTGSSFTSTGNFLALEVGAQSIDGATIKSGGQGFDGLGAGPYKRLNVTAKGVGVRLAQDAKLTDSLIKSDTDAVEVVKSSTLVNVTAVGTARGVVANHATSALDPSAAVTAKNVIARGAAAADDLVAEAAPLLCLGCAGGSATVSSSNIRSKAANGLVLGSGIQEGDPLFVSADDLHLQAASPARNAGTNDTDSTVDVDGDPRVGEGIVDIGGDEFTVPVAPTPTATAAPTLTPVPTQTADTTKPKLSSTRKGKRGRVLFNLSEPGTVKATIAKKAGKKFKKKGTQSFAGKKGANKVKLFIKGKALKPGRYKITLVATDASGNKSTKATIRLRVR